MSEAARDWSASIPEPPRPMRIEFATSELEGGPCRAWADPSVVLGAIAVSDPSEGFTKLVQPRLEELDAFGEATGGELPPIVTQLVDQLQRIHTRMVREHADAPATIALTCAAVEEDRVFFVKTCPAWIGLVRGTRAHAVERPTEEDFSHPVGLGASERLSLEVTSLPVQPGDIVVLLCSDMHAAPDLRAVANVFNQTTDLRRACDGLVNLLGLQSEGAGAIAFRFVPVGASAIAEVEPIIPLPGPRPALSRVDDPFAAMRTAMPPTGSGRPARSEAESFLDSLGSEGGATSSGTPSATPWRGASAGFNSAPSSGGANAGFNSASPPDRGEWSQAGKGISSPESQHPHAGPSASHPQTMDSHPAQQPVASTFDPRVAQTSPGAGVPQTFDPHVAQTTPGAGVFSTGPAHSAATHSAAASAAPMAASDSAAGVPGQSDFPNHAGGPNGALLAGTIDTRRRHSSRRNLLIPIVIVIVIGGLLALMAIPSGPDLPGSDAIRNLFGSGKTETGELQIRPDPPARAVLLDGVVVAEGTPTVLPAVEVGRHRVGLDLGLLGLWETDLEIAEGMNTLAPELTGSVKIAAADPSIAGHAWIDGGTKSPVPATLTDVPVGWVRIYYEDEKLPIWERQVLVRADRTSPLIVPNDVADGEARIEVEALSFAENRGLEPSSGDSIWIDDHPAGITPFEGSVDPGLHSVRVRSAEGGETFTDMIDVHPGGGRHVLAQFGVSRRPSLHHTPPGRVALSGKLVLSVEVSGELDPYAARPALHFPNLDARLREVSLTPVDGGENVFVGVVDADGMPRNSQLPYYFTILGPDGRPVYSDLYRVVLRDPSASNARVHSSSDDAHLAEAVPGRSRSSSDRRSADSGASDLVPSIKIEPSDAPSVVPSSELGGSDGSTVEPSSGPASGESVLTP